MDAILSAENITKDFLPRGITAMGEGIRALAGASLSIQNGERIAIVGGSGSGKSTLAACLAFLETPTSGSICFRGREIAGLSEKELRTIRPQVQLVFQDSANAFNPDLTTLQVLEEPLQLNFRLTKQERRDRASELLRRVGLQKDLFKRQIEELSGGQRQRFAIARALALEPRVLILDEALSAMDSSIQAQITNLLLDLTDMTIPAEKRSAIVLISHDLVMAVRIADRIFVMESGRIVESGPSQRIVTAPETEATKALVAATTVLRFTPKLRTV